MTVESPMLSTRKVAEMLRISPKAVRGLIAKGELHPLRPWRHWRLKSRACWPRREAAPFTHDSAPARHQGDLAPTNTSNFALDYRALRSACPHDGSANLADQRLQIAFRYQAAITRRKNLN
jgi:hypothetical protein